MSESFKAIDPENVVRQITFGQAEALVFQNRAAMAIAAANAIAAAMRRAAAMKSSFRMVFCRGAQSIRGTERSYHDT